MTVTVNQNPLANRGVSRKSGNTCEACISWPWTIGYSTLYPVPSEALPMGFNACGPNLFASSVAQKVMGQGCRVETGTTRKSQKSLVPLEKCGVSLGKYAITSSNDRVGYLLAITDSPTSPLDREVLPAPHTGQLTIGNREIPFNACTGYGTIGVCAQLLPITSETQKIEIRLVRTKTIGTSMRGHGVLPNENLTTKAREKETDTPTRAITLTKGTCRHESKKHRNGYHGAKCIGALKDQDTLGDKPQPLSFSRTWFAKQLSPSGNGYCTRFQSLAYGARRGFSDCHPGSGTQIPDRQRSVLDSSAVSTVSCIELKRKVKTDLIRTQVASGP